MQADSICSKILDQLISYSMKVIWDYIHINFISQFKSD